MKKLTRILSVLLVLAMVFALCPAVSATEETKAMAAPVRYVLTDTISEGDEVVIVCAAKNRALSATYSGYYNNAVEVCPSGGVISDPDSDLIWTVGQEGDCYTFSYGGQNLGMADSFYNMTLGEIHDEWALSPGTAENTFYVSNTVREVYMEYYETLGNWDAYYYNGDAALYELSFYAKEGGGTVDPEPDPEPEPDPDPEPTPDPECCFNGFTDCDAQWYHEAVDYVAANGLMGGVSATEFAPQDTMTRAMIVTVLYREAGSPAVAEASGFSDVPTGEWYSDAVAWAEDNGVVNGVGDGKFDPMGNVTRERIATILWRYEGTPAAEADLTSFDDAASISDYALEAMTWAVSEGILNGDNGNLKPTASAARAEFACMIMRYLGGSYPCANLD